jgi:hypothetical protein
MFSGMPHKKQEFFNEAENEEMLMFFGLFNYFYLLIEKKYPCLFPPNEPTPLLGFPNPVPLT